MPDERTSSERLLDAIVDLCAEDVLLATPEEVRLELLAAGVDPDQCADDLRARVSEVLARRRKELDEAGPDLARWKPGTTIERGGYRFAGEFLEDHPQLWRALRLLDPSEVSRAEVEAVVQLWADSLGWTVRFQLPDIEVTRPE